MRRTMTIAMAARHFIVCRGPWRRGMSDGAAAAPPLPQKRVPTQILAASHKRGRQKVQKELEQAELQSSGAMPSMKAPPVEAEAEGRLQYRGALSRPGVRLDVLEQSLRDAGYKYLSFKDLQGDHVHLGSFVIFRQVARPWKRDAIAMLVEDLDGTVEAASLHNFVSPLLDHIPDASFACPVDSVYLVFEPCLVAAERREAWRLRIDNPSLVVRLNDAPSLPRLDGDEGHDETLREWIRAMPKPPPLKKALTIALPSTVEMTEAQEPSPLEVVELGNALLSEEMFLRAAMTYTLFLERSHLPELLAQGDSALLRAVASGFSGRAQALIALDESLLAARDAEKAAMLAFRLPKGTLAADPSLPDAMLTWARALFNLHDVPRALRVLEESKGIFAGRARGDPTAQMADSMRKSLAKMGEGRSDPRRHGYNFGEMLRSHRESSPAKGEIEQFTIPHYVHSALGVGVSAAKGGARGVFAAHDIPPGTLLSATRPIGLALPAEGQGAPDGEGGGVESMTALACKYLCLQAVLAGGRAASAAEWLCAADVDGGDGGGACTDIDLLSETLKGGGRDWRNEPWVDLGALFDKATASMFDIDPLSAPSGAVERREAPVGFYGLASLYNHACTPNAERFFLGDVMFVTSVVPIAAGAEVTIDYYNAFRRWLSDEAVSAEGEVEKYWGFQCSCPVCEARRANPEAFAEAKRMLQGALHESRRKSPDKALAESLLEGMRALAPTLRIQGEDPFLSHMLFLQARIAGALNDKATSLALFEESFAACAGDTPLRIMFRPHLPAKMQAFSKGLQNSKRVKESKAVAQQARQLLLRHAAGSPEVAKAMLPDLAGLL